MKRIQGGVIQDHLFPGCAKFSILPLVYPKKSALILFFIRWEQKVSIYDHYACRDDPTQIQNTWEWILNVFTIRLNIMDYVCICSEELRLSVYVIVSGKIWDFWFIINFHLEIQTKAFLHYNSCLGSYREVFSSDRSSRIHNVCVNMWLSVCVAHKFV